MGLVAVTCALLLTPAHEAWREGGDEIPSDAQVRILLRSGEDASREKLIEYGERLFPVYERLLAHKVKYAEEIGAILYVLCYVKADRSQFIEHAVELLAFPVSSTRCISLSLLAKIGGVREASPVVALLSDEYSTYHAAITLAAIGGPRELAAFDVWLMANPLPKREDLQKHVAKCRTELKQRLEKQKKAGK